MKNLKKIRKSMHMTQKEVANKLNIAQTVYSGYESGIYEPTIDILIAMSKLFKVSIDYFVGNQNEFISDIIKDVFVIKRIDDGKYLSYVGCFLPGIEDEYCLEKFPRFVDDILGANFFHVDDFKSFIKTFEELRYYLVNDDYEIVEFNISILSKKGDAKKWKIL